MSESALSESSSKSACAFPTTSSAAFVRANADYPGRWLVDVEEIVSDGSTAAARARVYDDQHTFYVASFAAVAGGRITGLTEVWTDTGQPPHPSRIS